MKKDPKNTTSTFEKPDTLICSNLNWRYMSYAVTNGKNVLVLGDSGCGKTLLAQAIAEASKRPFHIFNCGAMSDPRASLIGLTQFDKERGTFFSESNFINAIRTKNAIILLDEISRCHPDGWNILMTALDYIQRYVRLDEKQGSETVKVAEGVTFVATANVGNAYTATRVMDRALLDRFSVIIEMASLDESEEYALLTKVYPSVDKTYLKALTKITSYTREQSAGDDGKITNYISTRAAIEMAALFNDGFSFKEVAEVAIYPLFPKEGGVESERSYIKQYAQSVMPVAQTTTTPISGVPSVPAAHQGNKPW